MGQDAFVDVAYRGLELGRRLKLREVGPRTAYLEYATPMPVGAGLVIRTDDGLAIPVVVIRVHEQVAGADMPPGMRVRTEALDGAAAGWWNGLVTREDPEIPEAELVPVAPPAVAALADDDLAPQAHDTAVMNVVEVAEMAAADVSGGNGAGQEDAARPLISSSQTVVMSAVEIQEITGTAGEGAAESDEGGTDPDAGAPTASGNGTPGSNGDELQGGRGRGKRRRRKR